MAIVQALENGSDGSRRLGLTSPRTNQPLGELRVTPKEEVTAAIARAREAGKHWARKPIAERAAIIRKGIDAILAHREEIVDTIRNETGKTRAEALAVEILPSLDFINYWCSRAEKDLSDEPRRLHGYLLPVKKLLMTYKPLGVVGVITPWNGPFALSVNPTVQALLAGNGVLLKPSEVSPHSGGWAARLLHEAGVPQDLLILLQGDGETGAALVEGGVDKISFTGSVRTGKRIAEACAKQLIPCTLELGGKDAMIVCDDANVERAANGAVFASMMNSGHVCMGVERIYVHERVADEFIDRCKRIITEMRYGPGDDTDIGSIFWDKQLPTIERHIKDAIKKGAKLLAGGDRDTSKEGIYFQPTLLTDLDHDMEIMREETFGPIAAVVRVGSEAEAIRLANDSPYGLSASVWTTDIEKGVRIAKSIDAGSVVINDAAMAYGVPEAPFGGRKESGLGHVNGIHALRSYAHAMPIIIDRWGRPTEEVWYPVDEKTMQALEGTIDYLFGTALRRFMT